MKAQAHRFLALPCPSLLLLTLGALGCAGQRSREETEEVKAFPREGLYLGVQVGAIDDFGDFDGDTTLVDDPMTPTKFVLIPDLDAGAAYGVSVAYRWQCHEVLLLWAGSDHDGTFQGASGFDTEFRYVDLLFKEYWWIDKPIQPYLMAGLGVSSARIDNGATDLVLTEDALLEDGVSLDLGAGLALYAGPWFSVFGQALWRFSSFGTADGLGPELPVSGELDSDSLELTVGANFRILRPHH